MALIALSRGTFLARPFARKGKDNDEPFANKPSRFAASYDGFDVHCGVRIAANDDEGRERLLRYCARPPFATDRIDVLKDRRMAYLMKIARRGSTHGVMTPIELMASFCRAAPCRGPCGRGPRRRALKYTVRRSRSRRRRTKAPRSTTTRARRPGRAAMASSWMRMPKANTLGRLAADGSAADGSSAPGREANSRAAPGRRVDS